MPKFTGIWNGLSGFIYYLRQNQAEEYINTTLDIEEYVGRTYVAEVKKKYLSWREKFGCSSSQKTLVWSNRYN